MSQLPQVVRECMVCVELRIRVHRAERERAEASEKLETHASAEAARAYRDAADELNRAVAMLAMHRKAHEGASHAASPGS